MTHSNTCDVVKQMRKEAEERISSELTTQRLVIKSMWEYADTKLNPY